MERLVDLIISGALSLVFYLFLFFKIKTSLKLRSYVKEHEWLQPNWICVWRTFMCLVGILIYFTSQSGLSLFLGILLFTVGACLDAVDGLIARECELITEFGKFLDPFCDKISYLAPLLVFSYQGVCSHGLVWWLITVEFMGQFLVRGLLRRLKKSVAAKWVGKLKAVACFALVIYCVLLDDGAEFSNFSNHLLGLCIALSIGSS
ncbi:MAG: CDP-alcohol phosphatidyltransferase family protein, partial [Patescibacteria group bacterium]|nr:CDP-alcohol phosphatidyltransferase family protein [Patescibacteria group bacterium]